MTRLTKVIWGLATGLLATLIVFLALEGLLRLAYFIRNSAVDYVPLPYVIGHSYGPIPPWQDGLRILKSDDALIWRHRPNVHRKYLDVFSPVHREEERTALLRQFLPIIPASLRGNPSWEISLNSEGFRDTEFPREKRPSAFRILCLGDSWTFGANVGQEQAYPQRLQARLRQEFPGRDFEVFNLGVLGYSSYQGLELLKLRGMQLDPDMLIIGFAMNDASVDGYRDKDLRTHKPKPFSLQKWLSGWLSAVPKYVESYKLLRYFASAAKWSLPSIGEKLRTPATLPEKPEKEVNKEANYDEMYDENEKWTRVSPRDYERNILEMIRLVRERGGSAALLFNEHWQTSPYRGVLDKISRAEAVPFVNSAELIAAAGQKIADDLETRLDLRPLPAARSAAAREVEIVFRVYPGDRAVPRAMYIVGNHPALGSGVPNTIAMYDDGTHGDQRAGDRVWSLAVRLPRGLKIRYLYTNSGQAGQWEGLDVPERRKLTVAAPTGEGRVYQPIETFGKMYMKADSWHPDATGYSLIVENIVEALKHDARFRRYLEEPSAGRTPA